MTNSERFWTKVAIGAGCWLWSGAKNGKGYGRFELAGTNQYAHRVAWQFVHGVVPKLQVLHRCDTPACVRPDHLFLGTNLDNNRGMMAKRRNRQPGGDSNGCAKLTASSVRWLRWARSYAGCEYTAMAVQYGVSTTSVHAAVTGKTWRCV